MPQDPNLTFKNDQIKSFRRIDPASVQFDDITLTEDFAFLDMVGIDGGAAPAAGEVIAGLCEDTAGMKSGDVGPGLIQRAILAVTADGALAVGDRVFATSKTEVKKITVSLEDGRVGAAERGKQCGTVLRIAADEATCVILFQAFAGNGNI